MHTVHAETDKIFLLQISMSVKTLQWLLDVLRTPSVVICPHISCASARLGSRVTVRWNVEVNSIYSSDKELSSTEDSLTPCYK